MTEHASESSPLTSTDLAAPDPAATDLSPLAWVAEELAHTFEAAHKGLRRRLRATASPSASSTPERDAADPFEAAAARFHQAAGALRMVGQPEAARVPQACEQAVRRLRAEPAAFYAAAFGAIEKASFAVLDFLRRRLAGKPVSPVALFAQYREVQRLAGAERIHPADLWEAGASAPRAGVDAMGDGAADVSRDVAPLAPAAAVVERIEQALLGLMRGPVAPAAARLSDLFEALAEGDAGGVGDKAPLWRAAAAFFDAQAHGLLQPDAYSRRLGSRLLSQLRAVVAGQAATPAAVTTTTSSTPDRLLHDLLFFCARADLAAAGAAGAVRLHRVRAAFGLAAGSAGIENYEQPSLGRYDPALLPQARRRVAALKESWSAASAGQSGVGAALREQAASVAESLRQLHPEGGGFGAALEHAANQVADRAPGGANPDPGLAMEVATGLLCIDAALDDAGLDDAEFGPRLQQLAERIEAARQGRPSGPVEPWMEELYRRASDRQTIGSVVQELRAGLAEIEHKLDKFARQPSERGLLGPVPAELSALRGVLSVLGLDQAVQAVACLRDGVEAVLAGPSDPADAEASGALDAAAIDRLADQVGALGFLIDLLGVQPHLAKSLFRFDPRTGRLETAMGRVCAPAAEPEPATAEPKPAVVIEPATDLTEALAGEPSEPLLPSEPLFQAEPLPEILLEPLPEPEPDVPPPPPEPVVDPQDPDAEMREIFFEEAEEVVAQARAALAVLEAEPREFDAVTTVRRAFHTLKGSSRMVGLGEFGEAAWACEQLFNACMARAVVEADPPLREFAGQALAELEAWTRALRSGDAALPSPEPLVRRAQALREEEPSSVMSAFDEPEFDEPEFEEPAPQAQITQVDPEPEDDPDGYKQIGSLRIGIPLFNIFLNEADEQSRRLCTELAEWSLELPRPVSEEAIAFAHSLAGNSATVGHAELSALARRLEAALETARACADVAPEEAQVYIDVADEIRRLLHQFAAGFLQGPPEPLLERLAAVENAQPAASRFLPQEPGEPEELDESVAPVDRDGEGDDFVRDLDAVDAIDSELFEIFVEEADELLPVLAAHLRAWEQAPETTAEAFGALRALHTLKGSGRLAGAMRLGELAHRLEAAFEERVGGRFPGSPSMATLHAGVDALIEEFQRLRHGPVVSSEALKTFEPPAPAVHLPELEAVDTPDTLPETAIESPPPDTDETVETAETLETVEIDWSRFARTGAQHAARPVPVASHGVSHFVRIRAALLDRLVNQAGEVGITRARLEGSVGQMRVSLHELTENLERLRHQLHDTEMQAETQMASRLEASKSSADQFDPLEMDRFTRFQELTRMMAESVDDVATVQRSLQQSLQAAEDEMAAQTRLTRSLQEDLLRARMVPFDTLSERLYRAVRQAAKESGAQVRLNLEGSGIELDRSVLDRIAGAFEHLLRNAVVHGIEPPEARRACGKDATGTIAVELAQQGNEVRIEVRDDGAGLDLARIEARARRLGLLADGVSADAAALAQFIFAPGFSTAESVTELAGRGVGMDVVRADVTALGGRIETASTPGQGTAFRLLLPLTTAVTQVVQVRCGELTVAVPASLVEVVRRVPVAEVERAHAEGHFPGQFAEGPAEMPFFWFGALLEAGARRPEPGRLACIIVVRSAGQRVALHVDQVIGNQEVVVKNLGPQLARLPGLAGVSLLPTGEVVPIYNPVALAAVYGAQARRAASTTATLDLATVVEAPRAPLVLVVDDSLTVRRVTQRLLQREGWRVALAKDGLEALERLQEERPRIMLTDIEMPRMDGFDLLRNVRADERWRTLPVVMITSRIAQKHRDLALQLGADHYLGKPYDEEMLVGLVRGVVDGGIREGA